MKKWKNITSTSLLSNKIVVINCHRKLNTQGISTSSSATNHATTLLQVLLSVYMEPPTDLCCWLEQDAEGIKVS